MNAHYFFIDFLSDVFFNFVIVKGSPGARTLIRSGLTIAFFNLSGSPLKGGKSGASTDPQWQSRSGVFGYAFAIFTAPSKVKCHSLSEKSKKIASGGGVYFKCSCNKRESPVAQMVPSGVSIMNPHASSFLKIRLLMPGSAF